jgi:hypothetical protein
MRFANCTASHSFLAECRTKVLKCLARLPVFEEILVKQHPSEDDLPSAQVFQELLLFAMKGEQRYLADLYSTKSSSAFLLGSLTPEALEKRLKNVVNKKYVKRDNDGLGVTPTQNLKQFFSDQVWRKLVQAVIARKIDRMLANSDAVVPARRAGVASGS